MNSVWDSLALFLGTCALIGFFAFAAYVVLALLEDTGRWLRRRP